MNNFPNNFLTKYFIIAALALGSTSAFAQVSISVDLAPPPLQVYDQPACPDDGYIWTPGYWAYGDNAYFWVPGAWVQPPEIGYLWTPPYWGWDGDAFVFNAGYWGSSVGYYGGINYGYGYGGNGYRGGRWHGNHFSYNTAVNNVRSLNTQNIYVDRTAINNNTNKVSYNGGKGGVRAKPTAQERQGSNERHTQPASAQQTEATVHSQAPIEEKTQPKQEAPRQQQPERQQQQLAPEQPIHQQQQPAPEQPVHQQQQPSPQQSPRPQEQTQPKQEVRPSQQAPQPSHAKEPAAQPDRKSANGPNNAPNH